MLFPFGAAGEKDRCCGEFPGSLIRQSMRGDRADGAIFEHGEDGEISVGMW